MKKVLVHGCFDVLHAGHLEYFKEAKKLGDKLIVGITTDRFVNKGPGRPHFPTHVRAEMVKALSIVDEVVISDYPTAVPIIEQIKPDYYVKGPDYKDLTKDVTGEIYNEKKAVEAAGGQLRFTDTETASSSKIINERFQSWTEAQSRGLQTVLGLCGPMGPQKALEEISKLRVLVVGEPIIDVYRFVTPEGISSKSPSISARFNYQEEYHGGVLAIANHLRGFAKEVMIQHHMRACKKIRYISGTQRIFEVTEIDDDPWNFCNQEFFIDKTLALAKEADVVILADFGHGLFEGPILKAMEEIETFTALNVQTNSSNFGFNVYDKHKRFDYLCLDTREARLAEHDRHSPPLEIAKRIHNKIGQKTLGVTLGPNGSCLYTKDGFYDCAAFANNIVDAVGAGDAFFGLTACLLKSGCPEPIIPFIGNMFAGLKTQIIGNKAPVTKASLIKAITAILK